MAMKVKKWFASWNCAPPWVVELMARVIIIFSEYNSGGIDVFFLQEF